MPAFFATAQDTPSFAAVQGSVSNKLTGAPVKNAHVIYTRTGPGTASSSPISTDTDADGNFSLQLTPGPYRLWVERNGFARQIYGALSPAGEGTGLTLASGQQLHQLAFRLAPLGAIAGRVLDEDGDPIQNAGIQVLRVTYAFGRRQLISVAGASSNDRGEYRVFGLRAGRYLLRASVPGAPMSRPFEAGALVAEAQDPYAAVYYPGVLEVDAASSVLLSEGGELADVDFRPHKVHAVTVRGRLITPEKLPSGQIQVVLAHNEGNSASYIDRASAVVNLETGRFEVRGVAPGSYLLIASQLTGGRPLGGRAPVEVTATAPPEDTTVVLTPAFDINGTVDLEGLSRGSAPSITLRLLPAEGLALGPQPSSKIASDGSIRLSGVTPGLWTIAVDSVPQELWVKTEAFAGNDILSGELSLNEGTRGQLRIVLSNNGAQISGTVTSDGKPCRATVVLAPASTELRNAHAMYRVTNTTDRGAFALHGIRPGSYKLFAFQEIEPFDWFDPDLLRTVETMGVSITVAAGESALQDVVAIPPDALLPQR